MTLRPAPGSARRVVVALDYEIAQEQASALGRLGRALEAALAALAAYDGVAPYDHGAGGPAATKSNPWYPDHAVFNATKDELKAMPEFRYSNN